jgi:hypothetical protein
VKEYARPAFYLPGDHSCAPFSGGEDFRFSCGLQDAETLVTDTFDFEFLLEIVQRAGFHAQP